ncbi:UNVERIFIED_CONTAM: Serine/threonine-protein phosphatase 7 long form [Sesamum indicum]
MATDYATLSWTWCPTTIYGQVQMDNNRWLPAAPYGATWNCQHTFNTTVRGTVRVIREILNEMQADQLWRSSIPLVFYAIVEMHRPERVVNQFGMRQNVPESTNTRDMSLHQISRKNHVGADWYLQHIQYITRWQRRYDTIVHRPFIFNRRERKRDFWEWYYNITRNFVSSSTDRRVKSGYQPREAPMLQVVANEVNALETLCRSRLPNIEGYSQLVDRFEHGLYIIKEAITQQPQQIVSPSDDAPTTSHRQRRISSRISTGSVERHDIGVDIAGPSTIYPPQDYYVSQPPQDYYMPHSSQGDWFQSTSYISNQTQDYSLDLDFGINQPYTQGYNISPIPFSSFGAYRDNMESSSATTSSRFGGDENETQNEPIQNVGEEIRRPQRQRYR